MENTAMLKLVQLAALLLILSTITSIPMLMAQSQPMPSAPIPAQILAAKKVFISNSGDDDLTIPHQLHAPTLTYNQFYADIKTWGKDELTSSLPMPMLFLKSSLTIRLPDCTCTLRSSTPKPALLSGRSLSQ
jgi:hypothetical protein